MAVESGGVILVAVACVTPRGTKLRSQRDLISRSYVLSREVQRNLIVEEARVAMCGQRHTNPTRVRSHDVAHRMSALPGCWAPSPAPLLV